jgi:hypothetical protein
LSSSAIPKEILYTLETEEDLNALVLVSVSGSVFVSVSGSVLVSVSVSVLVSVSMSMSASGVV